MNIDAYFVTCFVLIAILFIVVGMMNLKSLNNSNADNFEEVQNRILNFGSYSQIVTSVLILICVLIVAYYWIDENRKTCGLNIFYINRLKEVDVINNKVGGN